MLATPRAGLWTPRGRQAPSLMLPFGVAGTSPIGTHRRVGAAPTVTRAGDRYFQAGSSIAALGANLHCMEQDGAGDKYVSVYGELINYCPRSSDPTGWTTLGNATLSDSGVASPISGKNYVRIVEADTTAFHGAFMAATGFAQNQKCLAQALVKKGDRRYINLRVDFAGGGAAGVLLDADTGTIVDTGADATSTLHASGAIEAATGEYLLWLVCSDSAADPGVAYAFIAMADGATMSENSYDSYAGDSAGYPLGMLFCGATIAAAAGPIPIIETAAAAVTKSAEVITPAVADLGIPGSVELHARTWDTVPTNKRLWAWYDASSDAAIELFMDSAAHVHLRVHDGTSENADIEVATAINTGAWFPITASWEHNYVRLRVGSTDAIDTTCALPALADLDVCRIGASEAGQQFDGHLREFRAYKYRRI